MKTESASPGTRQVHVIRLRPCAGDCTPLVREALDTVHRDQPCRLELEKGEYNFYDEAGFEVFCFVSNNSAGLKRVAFPVIGRTGLEIEGNGSRLLFHGRMCPFLVRDSDNVTVRNLSIDYTRPFVSEGLIEEVDPAGVSVRLEDKYPYFFAGGRIWFNGGRYSQRGLDTGSLFKRDSFLRCLEFDTQRRETAYMAHDQFSVPACLVTEREKGLLHIAQGFAGPSPKRGNTMVISHDHRDCFGILVDQSRGVRIDNVTLHHTGAMAIIAQRSENITLHQCTVAPDEANWRMVSSFADASHFVSCRGLIRISGCRFENMLDDPVNVHGIYSPVRRFIDPCTLEIGNGHFEQAGIQTVDSGTAVRFVDRTTLLPIAESTVRTVEPINSLLWRIQLEQPVKACVKVGDCVESLHWVPDVEITGCHFGRNRARGPLITTGGDVLIENNHFHHAGSAIKISGDANGWYESGCVNNVKIRSNTFENCGYGVWGRGIIAIDPEIDPAGFRPQAYHRNIEITGNEFRTFHDELIFARCVDGLGVRDNRVIPTDDYPAKATAFRNLAVENCRNVDSQYQG